MERWKKRERERGKKRRKIIKIERWRDSLAQGKSRREKGKRNTLVLQYRDGERERVERSDGAGKASEREKEKRSIPIER